MKRWPTLRTWLIVAGLVTAVLGSSLVAQAESTPVHIRGAGTTIVQGGVGEPSFAPMITKVAFHWQAGAGHFECLALAPSAEAGSPGSGEFDTNVMYVTGGLETGRIRGPTAILTGTATVTGVGAGSDVPFTATLTRGGPGATLVLEIAGLTFSEILLEGEFDF
jgi:hypothetical protein